MFGMLQVNDGWDEPETVFDQQFRNPEPAQETAPQPFIQETKQEQKDVEEEVQPVQETEVDVPEEPAPQPAITQPTIMKAQMQPIAPARNVIQSSSTVDWKKQNFTSTSQPSRTRRKAPIPSQSASAPKHSIQNEASAVTSDDATVQMLMERVRDLEMKVAELSMNQGPKAVSTTVVTLNSTGAINNEGFLVWDSNHIIKPRKDLKLSDDNTEVIVLVRGLYQITFTTCGPNPTLLVNGDTYAAAISPLSSQNRTGTTSINIYLFLAEKTPIAGRINNQMLPAGAMSVTNDGDPCEHWLCARLVHGGF